MELDVEVIFINEFSVNSRHHEFSGWTKVGQKGYIITETKEFSMSFICSVSTKRVLGLMEVKESTTSDIIVIYLKRLFEELQKSNNNTYCECVVIWDNASVHSNSTVRAFIASSRLRVLSIPAITLVLNPAEKLINSIKMKIHIILVIEIKMSVILKGPIKIYNGILLGYSKYYFVLTDTTLEYFFIILSMLALNRSVNLV